MNKSIKLLCYTATLYLVIFSCMDTVYPMCLGHVSIIFMTMPIKKALAQAFLSLFLFRLIFSLTLSQWFAHLRPRFYWESLQFTYQKCNNLKISRTKLTRKKKLNKINWSFRFFFGIQFWEMRIIGVHDDGGEGRMYELWQPFFCIIEFQYKCRSKKKCTIYGHFFPKVFAFVVVKMDELNWLYNCVYVCLRARSLNTLGKTTQCKTFKSTGLLMQLLFLLLILRLWLSM